MSNAQLVQPDRGPRPRPIAPASSRIPGLLGDPWGGESRGGFEIPSASASIFDHAGALLNDEWLSLIGRLTWVSLLALRGREGEARVRLHDLLSEKSLRMGTLRFLAIQSWNRSTLDQVARPDRVVIALLLDWLGGYEAAQDLATVLTGGMVQGAVEQFFRPMRPGDGHGEPDVSRFEEKDILADILAQEGNSYAILGPGRQ